MMGNFATQQDVYEQKFSQQTTTKLLFLLDKFPEIPREFFVEIRSIFEETREEYEDIVNTWKNRCDDLENRINDLNEENRMLEIKLAESKNK